MIHEDSLQFAVISPGAMMQRISKKGMVLAGVLAPELTRIANPHESLPEMFVLTQWIPTYSLLP